MSKPELAERSAIIIGASQGLGLEIARHFLGAGANIAICARDTVDIEAAARILQREFRYRKILQRSCDIAKTRQIDQLFDEALAAFGVIDILVNCAGVHGAIGPIEQIDWALWTEAIAVNLIGSAYSCRRAVAHFKSRPNRNHRCKIINISGGGATTPQPGLTAYGASKAGLVRFTEALAEEVRQFAIDINAVAPGALATRLMKQLNAAGPEKIGSSYHRRVEEFLANGGAPPSPAAELCVYLASALSDGLTGRLIAAVWDPWPFSQQMIFDIQSTDIFALRRILPGDRGKHWNKQ